METQGSGSRGTSSSALIIGIGIAVLLAVLAAAGALFYQKQVGIPESRQAKTDARMIRELQQEVEMLRQSVAEDRDEGKDEMEAVENEEEAGPIGFVPWTEYRQQTLGYIVQYPGDYKLVDASMASGVGEFMHQIEFMRDLTERFRMHVYADSGAGTPRESLYYLDQESSSEMTMGGLSAKVYKFPNGYCDGPSCSAPFITVKAYTNDLNYAISFYNVDEITDEYEAILKSFEFVAFP